MWLFHKKDYKCRSCFRGNVGEENTKRNLAVAYVLYCISLLVTFFSCPNSSAIVWNSELEISTDSGRLARRSVERYPVWKYEVDMKRTYRFQEDSDDAIVGTLNMQKNAFKSRPERIEATLKVEDRAVAKKSSFRPL